MSGHRAKLLKTINVQPVRPYSKRDHFP